MSDKSEKPALPALLTLKMILSDILPVAVRTANRWIASGQFPAADVEIGGKARFWRRETVENWIAEEAKKAKV